MDKVIIREFRTEDLPVVQDIANGAWQPIYAVFRQLIGDELFEQTRPDPDAKRKQIKQHAETHPEWFIVAETADGKIAGFATYILDEKTHTGIIGNNAVDKTCGLKGVGQAMYAELFRRFKAAGMTAAQVTTGLDDGHAPARRAYQRAGFGEYHLDSITYYKKL